MARTIDLKNIDVLITDWESPDGEIEKIRQMGIEVLIAKEK